MPPQESSAILDGADRPTPVSLAGTTGNERSMEAVNQLLTFLLSKAHSFQDDQLLNDVFMKTLAIRDALQTEVPQNTSMLTMEKGGRGIYEHPVLVMDRIKQHIAALEVIAVGDDAYPVLLLSICEKSRIVQEKLQALLSTASSATGCRKKYSQMLQILESVLLDLRERFPQKNRTPMPSNNIVSDEFRAIERWLAERDVIYQALDTLCGEDFETLLKLEATLDDIWEDSDDNATFTLYLAYFREKNRLNDSHISQSGCLVSEVRGGISKLGPKVMKLSPRIPMETLTLVIKSLMLVYIPFSISWKVIQNPTSKIDIQTRTNMKSVPIWLAMKTLVQHVSAFLDVENPDRPSRQEVEGCWSALRDLIGLYSNS